MKTITYSIERKTAMGWMIWHGELDKTEAICSLKESRAHRPEYKFRLVKTTVRVTTTREVVR